MFLLLLQLGLVYGYRTNIANRNVLRFSTHVMNYLFSKVQYVIENSYS